MPRIGLTPLAWQASWNATAPNMFPWSVIATAGIIGLGESIDDPCGMLVELANLPKHPESVPVNALVAVQGTPLADREPVKPNR